jgi:hypothetical protein
VHFQGSYKNYHCFTESEGSLPADNSPLLDPIQSEWNQVHIKTVSDPGLELIIKNAISIFFIVCVCVCVCARARASVRACVRARVCVFSQCK